MDKFSKTETIDDKRLITKEVGRMISLSVEAIKDSEVVDIDRRSDPRRNTWMTASMPLDASDAPSHDDDELSDISGQMIII